ncbi:MAG: electron transport complex subunit RsxC [Clostridiales bacterium]|nr:electron transport complex subunit RsxC [Clostridiales bacterium]
MAFSLHGVRVPHRKDTATKPVLTMPTPNTVVIPTNMNIGVPAKPIVKVGDLVKVGTKIAEAGGYVSSPVFASVSGKVSKILESEKFSKIIIESDGLMEYDENLSAPIVDSKESLINAIKESGVVGLGGAGFPTHVKFDGDKDIDELIVNCAECEPYITSDSYTMKMRTEDMKVALNTIAKYKNVGKIIIGIEANKKAEIISMKKLASELDISATVKVLPSIYPQGGEKVLIYNTTKKVVPVGKLPIDVGVVVVNCTTLAVIGEYLKTGKPLTSKCVTVSGGAVKNPHNVIAPIGTSIKELIEFTGGFITEPKKIIYGGPMMGVTVADINEPILKNSNAILALTKKEAKLPETSNCIRCGRCTNVCPFKLIPAAIQHAYERKDVEALKVFAVNACMECGTCNYVCPANRQLVQTNKLAKALLKEQKEEGNE